MKTNFPRTICVLLLSLLFFSGVAFAGEISVDNETRLKVAVADEAASTDNEQYQLGLMELVRVVMFFCENIYPRPSTAECIDRAKHGVGSAFDPHSAYLNKREFKELRDEMSGVGFGGVGMELSKPGKTSGVIVINVIEDTPAYESGILPGDVITAIKTPNGFVSTISLKDTDAAVKLIRGDVGKPVTLKVLRKGVDRELEFTMVRATITVAEVKGELIRNGEEVYALIENKQFRSKNDIAMKREFGRLKEKAGGNLSGLIISLENNPGGSLGAVVNGVDLFLDAPAILAMRGNEAITNYDMSVRNRRPTQGDITEGLPILVVVNGGSASASEIFAGAMKHFGRAVIAGTEKTFGKGIVQTIDPSGSFDVFDDGAAKYTSMEYLIGSDTDYVPVQCLGVTPDIVFSYPGVKSPRRLTECELNGSVASKGPMANPPAHPPIKDGNPELYRKVEKEMLPAYIRHMMPKLDAEEARRKEIEQQIETEIR